MSRRTAHRLTRPTWIAVAKRYLNADAFPTAMADAAANTPPQEVRVDCWSFPECVRVAQRLHDETEFGFHVTVELHLGSGELYAHVSPNGRIWQGPAQDWTRETPELEV